MVGVFWIAGNATEMPIVKTIATKTQPCAITDRAILTRNSPAKMVDVFLNSGCAISIMIAVTILMSQHTCVGRRIVRRDGEDVQELLTTDAYQSGCSVTEKTIAEMDLMSCQRIVLLAIRRQILRVTI